MWKFVVAAAAVIVAMFFAGDADLNLLMLPKPPANAFAGQVMWIAGASSGIGAALAEDLIKKGATVIISARRVNQLNDVADKCQKFGPRPTVIEMDMTNEESMQFAFTKVIETHGHVDSLILNAGQSQRLVALDTPFEVTEKIMNLNFFSYVKLTKLVGPTMVKRNQGQIVVVSSLSGIIGTPAGSSYSASKFALVSYASLPIFSLSGFVAWIFRCPARRIGREQCVRVCGVPRPCGK